ncbi:MAG: hypothetical protein ACJ8FY_13000 [Gemmataceae bacterium]
MSLTVPVTAVGAVMFGIEMRDRIGNRRIGAAQECIGFNEQSVIGTVL